MRVARWVGVFVVLGALVAGCGGDDDASDETSSTPTSESEPKSRSDVLLTFDGKEFTCEETFDIDPEVGCSDDVVDVWEEWGENLVDYVNSGHLGPLNDESEFSFGDAAYAGVMACVFWEASGDEQDFIDFMQDPGNNTQLDDLSGTELLPAWFEANESLCPRGYQTGDYITP